MSDDSLRPESKSTRWRVEAAVAVLFVLLLLVIGGISVVRTIAKRPLHQDAATVPTASAAAPSARYAGAADDAERLARSLVVSDNLPGLSVAVAAGGEIVWSKGFGWVPDDNRTPITPRTRFRLGALSKPLTSVGAALLHDRGRLDLDAAVQRYVAAYPARQWPITTRQLLSDVGGVHRIRGDNNDAMPTQHCGNLTEAVGLLHDDRLLFEPGTQHRYSIWGWVLVSAAIEGAADQPFARFMHEQVFAPLGMERTAVAETEGMEVAHSGGAPPDYTCLAGGGAFVSTPSDLVRLGSAMLKPGLLKAETIADFRTPARLASGVSTTYALGWTVKTADLGGQPTRIVSHRGSPAGGTVSLLTIPGLGLAIAVAANVGDAKGVDPLALQIAETFNKPRR